MYNIHGLSREFNTNDYHAVLALYEERSRQLFLDAGTKLFHNKESFDITARILTPLGHVKWVRVLGFPKIENDQVIGITGITSDITAHKKTEYLLRASEVKFQMTFHSSSDLLALMREEDMVILDVNDSVFPILGYTREELIGNVSPGYRFYFDPSDRERFMTSYFHKGTAEIECYWRKKNGEPVRVFLKGTRVEMHDQYYFLIVIKELDVASILPAPVEAHTQIQPTAKLNRLLRQLEVINDDPSSKLALPSAEGFIFVRPKEIMYCEADGNYTKVHLTNNRKQVVTRTLKDFEQMLPPEFFFRTHHSYIINLSFIKKFNKGDNTLVLENGVTLDVAKRKKESFLTRIGIMRFPA
jgi:PAS domain S-box-containing protein